MCITRVKHTKSAGETLSLSTPQPQAPIRGRFAPSPTGRMHLGNVFCALLAWLAARSAGGQFLLRIEDLDPQRSRAAWSAQLQEDLLWLGLDWDEGGDRGGPYGPYLQSLRKDYYQSCLDKLCAMDLVYPCFCSRDELHAAAAPHASDGGYVYSGRCRFLSREEIAEKSARRAPALRLRAPRETIAFTDGCCGLVQENLFSQCGDIILRRSDGAFAYQLAVVADDAAMAVTQVVRGRDLLGSTPRQLYLYRLLGFTPPSFYHIPLLLAPDGRRLSKRDADLDMGMLRRRYSPEKLLGMLGFLCGLLPAFQPVRAWELVPFFSWEALSERDLRVPPEFFGESAFSSFVCAP